MTQLAQWPNDGRTEPGRTQTDNWTQLTQPEGQLLLANWWTKRERPAERPASDGGQPAQWRRTNDPASWRSQTNDPSQTDRPNGDQLIGCGHWQPRHRRKRMTMTVTKDNWRRADEEIIEPRQTNWTKRKMTQTDNEWRTVVMIDWPMTVRPSWPND